MILSLRTVAIIWLAALPAETAAAADGKGWAADLSPILSANATVTATDVDAWLTECASWWDQVTWLTNFGVPGAGGVSNYFLLDQPSGLCTQTMACAWEGCRGPVYDMYGGLYGGLYDFYQSEPLDPAEPVLTREELMNFTDDDSFDLQAATVKPLHVGDVVTAIKYAVDNKIGVSVKSTGHNWMGASTKKDTLNLNLSELKKYALPELNEEAITECEGNEGSGAIGDACKLASARGKKAVIRVGGGQIWDEALRTVISWNSKSSNLYHLVSGAAGTVSAAGGWLASGGLAGTMGHRMFGIGIDQVLHVEMVLPDGRHVRFGPSSWKTEEGYIYPQTETVTGYCNGDTSDEADWSWQECAEDVPFEDLWFATRGGGGGQYGVITAIYYQLHEKPGDYMEVTWLDSMLATAVNPPNGTSPDAVMRTWYTYLLTFLYRPGDLGVDESISRSCSGPDAGNLGCYNGAGNVFVDGWAKYSDSLFPLITNEASSYPELIIAPMSSEVLKDLPMYQRVPDSPQGFLLQVPPTNSLVISIDVVVNKLDEFIDAMMPNWLNPQPTAFTYLMYLYGGSTNISSDGMDALPDARRNGALHFTTDDLDVVTNLLKLQYDTEDESFVGDEFPGLFCHNHLYNNIRTPMKDNWLKLCDSDEDVAAGKCMSLQEASFGSSLKKLREIHTKIDPLRLFETFDGVGYDDSAADQEDTVLQPEAAEDESSANLLLASTVTATFGALIVVCL